jgi:uncharacterized protein (TIGR00296 family)
MLEETERDYLRKVARDAAARSLGLRPSPAGGKSAAEATRSASLTFEEISGLFVTWVKEGRTRGRSGTLAADAPLHTLVEIHSVEALLHDPRVPPATAKELPRHVPRISLLSAFEEIPGAEGLVVGAHGVVAEKGKRSGVVLPEDAEGLGWDGERLLGQACLRAGLPEESWKAPGSVRLRRFRAETF